ncbi:hypothetical protein AS188_07775 [Kocuria flava]|uniref:Uncharacterized protein n=1 Tax=Kocuria flava TaxID=446860 RepID=A0A0U3GK41_9MICC|nr:hypothetical protein AS188_07775 [Kocuria flava]
MASSTLEDMCVEHELQILHTCQQVLMPVVDTDADLHGTEPIVHEQRKNVPQGVSVESPIGIHDAHDNLGVGYPGNQITVTQMLDRSVESFTLPLSGPRKYSLEEMNPWIRVCAHDVCRVVVGAIVDDKNVHPGMF